MARYVMIVVLALLVAGCGTAAKTAPEVAGYVGAYLREHPDVERVATKGVRTATVIVKGQDRDIRAGLGEGLGGRLVRTGDAAYMRMAGEEPAPGKPWEKITAEHEPYNLFVLGMVTGEAMKLVDSHRVHGMLAARGQVSGPVSEGGLGRYTVAVDVRAALDGLDLAAFLDVYDPLPAMQDIEDEYERVRAGDPAAQARLRGRLIEEFGERATYELWIDGEGRPVRERLTAVTPVEVVFSHWDATAVSAPPADQVMVR